MPGYGADERALFEDDATKLYEEVCQKGQIAASDYRIAEDGALRAAFDLLVADGAAHLRQRAGRLGARGSDQRPVPRRLPAEPGGRQAPRRSPRSGPRRSATSPRAGAGHRSPRPGVRSPTCAVSSAINSVLDQLLAECEEELLTAQPEAGRDPRFLAKAALRDIVALERGVTMRTLYQHSARRSSVTHKYVAAVTARGAEVRTLDEFFNRMIVVDRRVAVIPSRDEVAVAVVDPRAGRGGLPRRRLRALLGARPARSPTARPPCSRTSPPSSAR